MDQYEKIKEIIFMAIDDINLQLLADQRVQKADETPLTGREASIDSMALVNLVLYIEEKINNEFGVNISLLDERSLSLEEDPFKNISTLIKYILLLLERHDSN